MVPTPAYSYVRVDAGRHPGPSKLTLQLTAQYPCAAPPGWLRISILRNGHRGLGCLIYLVPFSTLPL